MKKLIMLSALTSVLAVTGCTTMKEMVGMDTSPKQDVKTSQSNMVPVASQNGMLVGSANGMTLYTFDKDAMNKSNCTGDCLKAWPPLMATANAKATGQYSTFQRDDGTYQWAVNGKPLYFFAKDMKAGDANGDKMGGVWHILKTQ